MNILYADIECRSTVPISSGTYAYAEQAQVTVWVSARGDDPVTSSDYVSDPDGLFDCIRADVAWADLIVFHNLQFDRTVLAASGINLPLEKCHCTMAQAYAHALPGSLEKLGDVFGLSADAAKDKAGRRLVQIFCVPGPTGAFRAYPERGEKLSEWAAFVEYAKQDVVALREVFRKLPKWNYKDTELELWRLDQKINDRGIGVDMPFVDAIMAAVEQAQRGLAADMRERTDGDVEAGTQRDALLAHLLVQHGVDLPDMRATTVERAAEDEDLPLEVRALLHNRLQASTSSTAKYKKMAVCVSSDGRLRGTLQYAGAGRTRRWAGRHVQLQNLPRPTLPTEDIEAGIETITLGGKPGGDLMVFASSAVRGAFVPGEGQKFCVADLANIEGRVAAWLAGEAWKLDAFRAYDLGTGPDLYKLAYARAFGIEPAAVTKDQRQVGKVMELMLQYQGGVGAFLTGANTYRIDLDAMAKAAWPAVPVDVQARADEAARRAKRDDRLLGLSTATYAACDALKILWRTAHHRIADLWPGLESGCVEAMQQAGETVTVGKFKIRREPGWLRIRLPSGPYLVYPQPKLIEKRGRTVLSFMGVDQFTRKWKRLDTYGGKLLENATQSVARDVLASSFFRLEEQGFEIVASVHDEIIAEAPAGDTDLTGHFMAELMSVAPRWAYDMPLAAEGFDCHRYQK